MNALRIDYFDSRFARKEVADKDPRNNFFMTNEGFIVDKRSVKKMIIDNAVKNIKDDDKIKETDELEGSNGKTNNQERGMVETEEIDANKNKKLNEFF